MNALKTMLITLAGAAVAFVCGVAPLILALLAIRIGVIGEGWATLLGLWSFTALPAAAIAAPIAGAMWARVAIRDDDLSLWRSAVIGATTWAFGLIVALVQINSRFESNAGADSAADRAGSLLFISIAATPLIVPALVSAVAYVAVMRLIGRSAIPTRSRVA